VSSETLSVVYLCYQGTTARTYHLDRQRKARLEFDRSELADQGAN
jgi:hypothetical protein